MPTIASFDVSGLEVTPGHDSLTVTWAGFYNADGGENICGDANEVNSMPWLTYLDGEPGPAGAFISGWEDTSFGKDGDDNDFDFATGEKIVVSVMNSNTGLFSLTNKVIHDHTDLSNTNSYTVEGLTAGDNYIVMLKAYKTDTSGSLRIYERGDDEPSGVPFTVPDILTPRIRSLGSDCIEVRLPGTKADYFKTGLVETGYSALNYISIVLIEEGSGNIEISTNVAPLTALTDAEWEQQVVWKFDGRNSEKKHMVRLDYENDTGTIVSTQPVTIEMSPCADVSAVNLDLIDFMDLSLNWEDDTIAKAQMGTNPYTTKLEFKASTSFGTTHEEFELLPVLSTKHYLPTDEQNIHNFKLLDMGVTVKDRLLQIGFYHVVLENGVYVDGPKSHKYVVLLPKDGESPWATLPDPAKHFKLLRAHEQFTISSESEPELAWYEELSAAYYTGELSNNIGHGDILSTYDSEYNTYGGDRLFELEDICYTYDWCGELLLPKTFDTTRFDLDSNNELHVPAVFGLLDGLADGTASTIGGGADAAGNHVNSKDKQMANSNTAYGANGSDCCDNVVINVWKRTELDTNYTYKYRAYQVKDREFANELSLNISAGGTVNEETLTLAWSGATRPVKSSSGVPYYFAGLDICGSPSDINGAINYINPDDQAKLPDASFETLTGFELSDKNTNKHATTTIVSDNSFSLIRIRPYFTIVNSDNTTDELSGEAEDLSFVGYKLPVISEINIGNLSGGSVPVYKEAQGSYYPFNAEDQKGTLVDNTTYGGNIGTSGEYIVQIRTSGGAGYRTEESAGTVGDNKHDSADRADVSVNFFVTVQDMSDLDVSFEFDTSFGDSSYVAVPQQINGGGSSSTGGNGLWGTSGEYYLSIPVSLAADGDALDYVNLDASGVQEGKKFKVTLEPYINTVENPTDNISGEAIIKYLYTRPVLDPVLHTRPLVQNDASGNPNHLTSSIILDLSGVDPSGEFISKIEFFRDEETQPFSTLNPVVTRVDDDDELVYNEDAKIIYGADDTDREFIDNTAYPESAHIYRAKVHYEGGWAEKDMVSTTKELIYRDLKLKDYGFENMIIKQLTEVSDNGITYDQSAVDISLIFKPFSNENTMYKHFVRMHSVADTGLLKASQNLNMYYYYINSLGVATTLENVASDKTTVANFHTEPVGVMMSAVDLSQVKLLDLSYSVIVDKTIANERILKDVREDDVSGKTYVIHNYVNNKVSNVVLEAVHTDHDAIPDQTLLAFERPEAYPDAEMTAFGELDNFELVIDGVSTDICFEEGGQLIPNSENPIELKTKFTFKDSHPEIITSEVMHGEAGLDLTISRPNNNTVTFSSPNDVNAYPAPTSMEIVDFGDCSGYLKFTAATNAVGAILFRTQGEYDNEDEICGWHHAELLDTSATGEYLGWTGVSGTAMYSIGTTDDVFGNWNLAGDPPIGYIDFSFDNVDGYEYKFGISNDDCSYGDKFGARLVYSNDGATAVSNLRMIPYNSAVAPVTDTPLEITDIVTSTSPNEVTFKMKENETLGVAAQYEIIVYEVPAIHPNSENEYDMWDGSGGKITATAKEQNTLDSNWKVTTFDRLHLHTPDQAITASSMSNSVTLSNSKLQPNKVYVARGYVINTNGNIRSTSGSDTVAFDVVELGKSPSVSLVPNEVNGAPYTTVTLNQPYDSAARFIEVRVEGDINSTSTDSVVFAAQFTADNTQLNTAGTSGFGFANTILSGGSRSSSTMMHLTDNTADPAVADFSHLTTVDPEPKNIIGTWSDKLKFHLSSGNTGLDLSSGNWPDISLTIYPSVHSDRPVYTTGDVPLQLYESPFLTSIQSSAYYSDGQGIYLREYTSGQTGVNGASSAYFTNGFNIARNEVLVMHKARGQTGTPSPSGGSIDSLIMVVGFESDESEGVTVKTFNKPDDDSTWTSEVVNKVFTIDGLPTGAMIVSVTVIATNNVGSTTSPVTKTANYVDE